jgi:hypothetical protein
MRRGGALYRNWLQLLLRVDPVSCRPREYLTKSMVCVPAFEPATPTSRSLRCNAQSTIPKDVAWLSPVLYY